MNNPDAKQPTPPQTLTVAQVADRMGLTTRSLQSLRLRGLGPQIVQRGLSIHYPLADLEDIERQEAHELFEHVLASQHPLVLLRAMADSIGFRLSPVLQHVTSGSPSPEAASPPVTEPHHVADGSVSTPDATTMSRRPERSHASKTRPATPAPSTATTMSEAVPTANAAPVSATDAWYLLYTKPR